jgi:hypothetical protein
MFDAPVDAWYVWIGLALVAAAAAGTAAEFPTAPPPDARAAAATVDRVAAADHTATARHPLDADAVKVATNHVSLRDDGRTSHARLTRAVIPVQRGSALWRVLRGAPPAVHYERSTDLQDAVREARDASDHWRPAEQLFVRTVTWEDVHVTLVGA